MILVAVISEETAVRLAEQTFNGTRYNPVEYQDKWIISLIEAQYIGDPSLILEIVVFVPEVTEEEV